LRRKSSQAWEIDPFVRNLSPGVNRKAFVESTAAAPVGCLHTR
jgi:hypothetical protein